MSENENENDNLKAFRRELRNVLSAIPKRSDDELDRIILSCLGWPLKPQSPINVSAEQVVTIHGPLTGALDLATNQEISIRGPVAIEIQDVSMPPVPDQPPILPPPEGDTGGITSLAVPLLRPRIFFQDADRLARAQVAFAADPITNWRSGVGEAPIEHWKRMAVGMLGIVGSGSMVQAQSDVLDDLRSFTIPEGQLRPDANGSDQYRWGAWFPVAYDWFSQYLDQDESEVIRQRYTSYVLAIREQTWGGPDLAENNYFWANFHNEVLWALAIYHEDRVTAESLLAYALTVRWPAFLAWANGDGRGGLPGDGSSYGVDQLNLMSLPILALRELGQDIVDATTEEWLCGAMYRLCYDTGVGPTMRKGGQFTRQIFPYHDQEKDGGYPATDERMGSFAALVATLWPADFVGGIARWWLGTVQQAEPHWRYSAATGARTHPAWAAGKGEIYSARPGRETPPLWVSVERWLTSTGLPLVTPDTLPLDYYCPGSGFLYSGSWDAGAIRMVWELGLPWSSGHRHICPGSFQIRFGGEYLVKENSGYSADRKHRYASGDPLTSDNHQCLRFNGQGMCDVAWTDPISTVKRLHVTPDWAFAAVDLANAYHSERSEQHNPHVRQLVRELYHLRRSNCVVVLDRYEKTAANVTVTSLMHFPEPPRVMAPGRAVAWNTNQELLISTLVPSNPGHAIVNEGGTIPPEERDSDGGFYQWTLQTHYETPDVFGYLIQVLHARPVGSTEDPAIALSDDAVSWTLRVGTDVLVIAKGPESVGGSVNGVPLRADVQGISVGRSGVTWGA